MKIILTGALGHIGSKLIRELPNQFKGLKLILLDNLMTQRYCSLFYLPKEANYLFKECDVKSENLIPFLKGADVVVHLAAITDAAGSFDIASLVDQNNLEATRNVAEACLGSGTRMIHLSSTSVYGTQKRVVDEDCPEEDLQPQSPYAMTKLKEELLVKQMVQERGLKAVTFRFGTVFGVSPGMRFHTAVNKFCWQAAMGLPITVWRTAYDQKRPYLDLKDACNAVVHAIQENLFDGQIYNVLTLNTSVREIVNIIKEYKPNLQIDFVDSPVMNQLSYEVSTKKFLFTKFEYKGNLKSSLNEELGSINLSA